MIGAVNRDGQQGAVAGYTAAALTRTLADSMNQKERIKEILETYQKHGWRLRRLLLRPETSAEVDVQDPELAAAEIKPSEVDAVWFSRASHAGREAWELRLISETQYALFETFEADEAEEDREEVRMEMEAKMRQMMNAD